MYFKDFSSGAMIENIVRRAKKLAIKRQIAGGAQGIRTDDLIDVDPAGVQGARGPAEHDQPRRLGEDLGQEGRAHRLRAHARARRDDAERRGRPGHRAGGHRPVPLSGPAPARRRAGRRRAVGSDRGDPQGLRHRDRVRHRRARRRRVEPDRGVVGADQRVRHGSRHAAPGRQGRLGLRGRVARQRRPRLRRRRRDARPRSRPTSSTRCSPTAPATTSTTPIPSSRRPSAPTPARSCVYDRAAELILQRSMEAAGRTAAAGPGDRRLQEQLRRQGQQLRLPRELPDGPGGAVRPDRRPRHAALRHPPDLHGRRQGRLRGAGRRRRRRAVPAHPAGRLLRGGGRPRDHAEAPDRQHPRRAPLPTRRSTGGST